MRNFQVGCVVLCALAATIPVVLAGRASPQAPLLTPTAPKQIAIIGAGASGSSTAYHLRRFASAAFIPANITIFERASYIGGRSTTVHAYLDPSSPALELGASIFVDVNHILVNASRDLGLSTSTINPRRIRPFDDDSRPDLGVFDGSRMVLVQQGGSYWDLAKLVWRYGLAPWRTVRLMRDTVGKFLGMYEGPVFPFDSLDEAVEKVGLRKAVGVTGEQLLESNGITWNFGHDVVQASTRVNYAIDLDRIHGVEAMVCMAAEGAMSVEGGNWRIFDGMVNASGALRALETQVRSVRRLDDGKLEVLASPVRGVAGDEWRATFDEVVLAAPIQFASIEWGEGVLHHVPQAIPYVDLHVTLLTTKHKLDPTVFGLQQSDLVPQAVLTTTPAAKGFISPEFFSISILRQVMRPDFGELEYAYKIFTPVAVNSTFLGRIFGLGELKEDADISKENISWIYRKLWQSYPVELPRVTFEEIKIGQGVWYTSGMESFISTMETSSLMGMNVARLMANKWAAGL